MNNQNEMERRAKLVAEGRRRLEELKKTREAQKDTQGETRPTQRPQQQKPDFKPKPRSNSRTSSGVKNRRVDLPVKVRHGEVVHAQKMVSQDINAKASQHIIGVPVNKSQYNGYHGEQLTLPKIRQIRNDPAAVRIIPLGGMGELGIGKNMTLIEYGDEIVVVDMGLLFANEDYPGVNYMTADISYLTKNIRKVKALCFTHAHLDHIGACRVLLPDFGNMIPVYATEFTNNMIKKQMDEIPKAPLPNYINVDPAEHKIIKLSEHLSVEFIHVLHSIPGCCALVFRTPNGTILMSGDWRFENKTAGTEFDMPRMLEISKAEGIDLMLNESTNIDTPGSHPYSEFDVGENIGKVMDNRAGGRIIVSCFSSQVMRMQLVLDEANKRGRKVAFAGYSMVNNIEVAVRSKQIKIPKNTIMKMEDIIKLPDEQVVIVCTGSQGELNATLNKMITGSHRFIKVKSNDTIIFSSSPIPGNEVHVVGVVDGLLREGAQVFQHGKTHIHGLGPLHLSGHAYYDDHVKFVTTLKPKHYMPIHGEFYMLEHNAEMAENVAGIAHDKILVCDDGDIVELLPNKSVRKQGRMQVGTVLYDDTGAPIKEAVVKDRLHMSTEGIFVVIITISKKTGQMLKYPDIISRGFIYMDNSEVLVNKVRDYIRIKMSRAKNITRIDELKQELKDDISHILYDATEHSPVVIPVVDRV
ncbi:MAG: ribonuclease J [Candidatus Nomurabacteria bacterium]|jgi:ribonuclease J|nr:ribonuclease J [Candidatus Nomurabacteria bacterium]